MKHPDNFDSEFSNFFVDNIEFNYKSLLKKIIKAPQIIERVIYSFQSKTKIEKLINEYKPDIAHLHMIDHQISPSILHTLKKYGIPIIQTVHQYKLVCPNYKLYIPTKNKICEKCISGNIFHPIIERCHKDSIWASALLTLEAFVHKTLKLYNDIAVFHAPSDFMATKLIKGGLSKKKVVKLFYAINLDDFPFSAEYSDYFIYIGRLSKEKGILTLLKSMRKILKSKLLIIGDGPQRLELARFVSTNKLTNVQFLGNKSKNELRSLVSHAKFSVVPSEWYDNSPLVIYESFSMGKPVIGADIGGISELIDHHRNGLLFQSGNVMELSDRINYLLENPELIISFGKEARLKAEQEFSPQLHYEKIYNLYKNLLN